MTLIEAIENTMLSSCFIESTNGALCFHYYKHRFFLNNGETIELNNEKTFEECAKLDYIIKYGIHEINYNALTALHEKLEKGEFDSNIDSFLSVYDSENASSYIITQRVKDKLLDVDVLTPDTIKDIEFEDVGFTAFTIKYFLKMYKRDAIVNSILYVFSFLLMFFVSNLYIKTVDSWLSIVCLLILFFISCINDTFEVGVTPHNILKFFISTSILLLTNIIFFNYNNLWIGSVCLIGAIVLHHQTLSFRAKAIQRICTLFDLEVFK